jgi:hypothetical protein
VNEFVTGLDGNTGGNAAYVHRVDLRDGSFTQFWDLGGYDSGFHDAGQWYQPAASRLGAYYLKSLFAEQNQFSGASDVPGSIAFISLDGADRRVLAHGYAAKTSTGMRYPQDYPFATLSFDGKLVMWHSTMNMQDGRSDVFIAEVPLRSE